MRLPRTRLLALPVLAGVAAAQTPTVLPGWPVEVDGNSVSGGLLVDLDGDLEIETIYVSGAAGVGSEVHVLSADGTYVAGWPQFVDVGTFAAPAAGDIDGDGDLEIVLTTFFFGLGGTLWAFHHDGSTAAGFPTSFGGTMKGVALGDLDADGDLEILASFNNSGIGSIYAIDGDGSVLPGWPRSFGSFVGSAPSVGDVDGDGTPEIFAPGFEKLYGYRPDGTDLPGFPFDPPNQFFNYNTVSLADLDGNGDREIVFATSDNFVDNPGRVWVLEHTGVVAPGWPRSTSSAIWAPPALADLTGNGELDIVLGDQLLAPTPVNSLFAWNRTGALLPGFPVTGLDALHSQVTIADVDGDQLPEILYETNVNGDDWYAVNHDGTPVAGWPLPVVGSSFNGQLSVADVNGDGLLDISGRGERVNDFKTDLYLWTTTAPASPELAPVPTHMYRGTRDGVADSSTSALVVEYGCGINPPGSLALISGSARIGDVLTVGAENPLGTQASGAVFLMVSSQAAPGYPCGIELPGFGMSGPFGVGELLIGLTSPFPELVLGPGAWVDGGPPAEFVLPLPFNPSLVGVHLYLQGAIAEPFGVTFTSGLDARLGH